MAEKVVEVVQQTTEQVAEETKSTAEPHLNRNQAIHVAYLITRRIDEHFRSRLFDEGFYGESADKKKVLEDGKETLGNMVEKYASLEPNIQKFIDVFRKEFGMEDTSSMEGYNHVKVEAADLLYDMTVGKYSYHEASSHDID